MKDMIRSVFKSLSQGGILTLGVPWIILFLTTSNRSLITKDLQRWITLLNYPDRKIGVSLTHLLWENPEFRNLFYFRIMQGNRLPRLFLWVVKFIYPPLSTLFIDTACTIGPGLFIQHGFSTIIMADIGENCWINQQVTIGYKDKSGRPQLGNEVRVTAGAKVIGNIKIGHQVTIGANAVVVKDVPDRCVVVGVPGYIIKRDGVKVNEPL
jgi:serine O-acetyltransferase